VADLDELANATGFDWDGWNADKIWEKHRVSQAECEQLFFNEPLIVGADVAHSKQEKRYYALGATGKDREMFVVFTLRGVLIRVVTARDMSRRERRIYEDLKEEGNS
jgi:uncharacterized DUF497 family protein